MASLSPEEFKSLAQDKTEDTSTKDTTSANSEQVTASTSSLEDEIEAKIKSDKKSEKPKDFKQRAEEMEAEHLKVIKASSQDPAPEFSVS
jgi:hypothetical protein